MWRKICVVLLLGPMAKAQSTAATKVAQTPCETDLPLPDVAVKAFQSSYYDVLPRGREETVAVVLYVPKNVVGCCPLTSNPNQKNLVPISLQLSSEPGITLRYKGGHHYKRLSRGTSIDIGKGQKFVLLKVRADRDSSLGPRQLRGVFTFQKIRDGKVGSPEQINVQIPITIAEQNAKIEKSNWPFEKHIGHDVANVLLLPVELPALLLLAIACHTGSGCDL